jgi:hypothetical protein
LWPVKSSDPPSRDSSPPTRASRVDMACCNWQEFPDENSIDQIAYPA